MFPAFGLYTHIRANRIRSVVLIVALALLVYVLTFAGALFAESLGSGAPLDVLLARAAHDLVVAAPVVTLGTAVWVLIAYQFHQRLIDIVTGSKPVTRDEEPGSTTCSKTCASRAALRCRAWRSWIAPFSTPTRPASIRANIPSRSRAVSSMRSTTRR